MKKYLPDAAVFVGRAVPGFADYLIAERLGSGGNGHVFRAHSEQNENDIACKIIPFENVSVSSWRDEVRKPNRLRSAGIVRCFTASEWIDTEAGISCLLICSDFVRGYSLKQYLSKHRNELTVAFVERFLRFHCEV